MKISKLIKGLEEFKEKYGDLECYCASDEEGNSFEELYSITYLLQDESGEIGAEEGHKVCILN